MNYGIFTSQPHLSAKPFFATLFTMGFVLDLDDRFLPVIYVLELLSPWIRFFRLTKLITKDGF